MNLFDLFEELWPGEPLDAYDELLWLTPYPCADVATIEQRLREFRAANGPVIAKAINVGYAALPTSIHPEPKNDPT
jgi:hypothetical protein